MIAIIDYGMGNLRSVERAFEKVGFDTVVTDKPEIIENADKIVLPGVGAFKDAKDGLQERGLIEPIKNHIKQNKLFLGICLGLHLLFTRSYEDGVHEGLDIVPGEVVRFNADRLNLYNAVGQKEAAGTLDELPAVNSQKLKIPHMGWNNINIMNYHPLLKGFDKIIPHTNDPRPPHKMDITPANGAFCFKNNANIKGITTVGAHSSYIIINL